MVLPKNKLEVRELSPDEGGGYFVTFPDLPGCASDGDTLEEALNNAAEAENTWLAANKHWEKAKNIPPARLVARFPRSVHLELQRQAAREGVSINTMLVSLVSHGLGEISTKLEAQS